MCIGSDMKKRPPIETTAAYCGRSPNLAVRASLVSTPQRANQNGVPRMAESALLRNTANKWPQSPPEESTALHRSATLRFFRASA
jgi:hypothetical protein